MIFIEGFNPSELQNQTYEAMKTRLKDFLNISTSSPPMWQRLYDEGYDLIYVDFDDGAGDIVTNAQVVKRAILLVNEMKHAAGSSEKTKVIGASMGGVVGKWALREMEIAGEVHEVDQFTSFDAPLKGANVPLGIQHMIKDLATRNGKVVIKTFFGSITLKSFSIGEFIPLIQTVKTVFNKPATKQMLFYNAWADESNPRQFHDAFYSQFEALGDLQQIEHIKVSNGSSIGQTQLLNAGELYATVTGFGTTPVRTGIGRTSIDVTVALDLKIFAIPASGNGTIYGGNILLSVPGGATVVMPNPIVKAASGLKPFDSAPGGFENFGFPFIAGALSFDRVIISANFGTKTNGLWGFIPTFSSLGIAEPSDVNAPLTGCGSSSSDGCIASNSAASRSADVLINGGFAHNQGHVTINQRNYDFILSKLHTNFIDFNAPNGILTRTFNYGKSNQTSPNPRLGETVKEINRSVTVQNTGAIWVNRNNKIGFIDENNLQNQANALFDLRIKAGVDQCVSANSTVTLQNGGSMILGDPSVNNTANVHIDGGGILNVKQNGTLSIENNSQLIIESGGKLIIESGAILNLVGSESKIVIKQGGQLIIGGEINITGNGHFLFEQGNVFTLSSNLLLRGASSFTPLIKIGLEATVIVTNPFVWRIENATILHEGGETTGSQRYIWLKNGATFRASSVSFENQKIPPFGPISGSFVVVEDPFDLNNDPDDVDYSFEFCSFQDVGIAVELNVPYAQSMPYDFRNVNLEFKFTSFTNCQALRADRSYTTLFENCTLVKSDMDIAHTYWLNIRETSINFNPPAGNGPPMTGRGNGTAIKARYVGHLWFRENSLIDSWTTGIDDSEGAWNIINTESTIQRCGTSIILNGLLNPTTEVGLLYMKCTRLIQNDAGIKGQDIIFSLQVEPQHANIFTRNMDNPNGLFIESIFRDRQNIDTELQLFRNYWDGMTPPTTPVNDFWSFRVQTGSPPQFQFNPWVGTIHIDPVRTTEFDPAVETCGGIELRDAFEDPLAQRTIVNINGILYDVKIQRDAGMLSLNQNNLVAAQNLLNPVAEIPQSIRDTASPAVNHFIAVSRALTLRNGVQSRSKSSSGWLPEAIVGIAKPQNMLVLSPNPANEQFDISLPRGDYDIQVFDALGKRIFTKNTEGVTTVDVRSWHNGIYIVNLLDKVSKKKTFSKVVVQH